MTTYGYVSVHEYTSGPKEGQRFLKFGKGEMEGSDIIMSTPENDVEMMERAERERVELMELPMRMPKSELKQWLEDNKPAQIWDALEAGESDDW